MVDRQSVADRTPKQPAIERVTALGMPCSTVELVPRQLVTWASALAQTLPDDDADTDRNAPPREVMQLATLDPANEPMEREQTD